MAEPKHDLCPAPRATSDRGGVKWDPAPAQGDGLSSSGLPAVVPEEQSLPGDTVEKRGKGEVSSGGEGKSGMRAFADLGRMEISSNRDGGTQVRGAAGPR